MPGIKIDMGINQCERFVDRILISALLSKVHQKEKKMRIK